MGSRIASSVPDWEPIPKHHQKRSKKKRHGLNRAGKKAKAWDKARASLKVKFYAMGITSCEGSIIPHECWHDNGLSFAHSKKRADIKNHELYEVALLCPNAHAYAEALPKKEMCELIRQIIANRHVEEKS